MIRLDCRHTILDEYVMVITHIICMIVNEIQHVLAATVVTGDQCTCVLLHLTIIFVLVPLLSLQWCNTAMS